MVPTGRRQDQLCQDAKVMHPNASGHSGFLIHGEWQKSQCTILNAVKERTCIKPIQSFITGKIIIESLDLLSKVLLKALIGE